MKLVKYIYAILESIHTYGVCLCVFINGFENEMKDIEWHERTELIIEDYKWKLCTY